MLVLKGKYNEAKVFSGSLEATAESQIVNLLNQEFVKDSIIRIMPDVHAGAGCTIGTTMTIKDKIVPNLVGVDIGCGMETLVLENRSIDLALLDRIIHENIPAGFKTRNVPHAFAASAHIDDLHCINFIDNSRAVLSIGTLGGGNHFIELDKDDEDRLYLVVHSGSRHLGKQIAEHYQNLADASCKNNRAKTKDNALRFVTGALFVSYLHDMNIAQNYAALNRRAITEIITEKMKLNIVESFTTVHNYIDMECMILRKGAVSAKKDERLLIPINMRDGSIICRGKGNRDWNFSAPHGAGRIMSRSLAKKSISVSQYKESMRGIFSSTVNKSTLDESPFAYKPIEEIVGNIGDTVEINHVIKPLYNFKSAE
jgi:RNA-splicing ligase RtcB